MPGAFRTFPIQISLVMHWVTWTGSFFHELAHRLACYVVGQVVWMRGMSAAPLWGDRTQLPPRPVGMDTAAWRRVPGDPLRALQCSGLKSLASLPRFSSPDRITLKSQRYQLAASPVTPPLLQPTGCDRLSAAPPKPQPPVRHRKASSSGMGS